MPSRISRRIAANKERVRELWEQVLLQWLQQDDCWYWRAPEQINSGAIFHYQDRDDIAVIQACTRKGMEVYGPLQRREPDDIQSANDPVSVPMQLSESYTWTSVNVTDLAGPSLEMEWPTEPVKDRESPDETEVESSPEEILDKLKAGGMSREEERQLIVEAEVLFFDPQQTMELREVLREFIEHYRNSNDPQELTAVASAIRKFVGIMDRADLGSVCFLLDSGHEATVPLKIELEVAKMVVRKLTANPPDRTDPEPDLADRLMELVRAYANPRLLAREKYGAVVLNGILALVLLGSKHMDDLFATLEKLPVTWFKQTLARRARRVMNDIAGRLLQERCGLVVQRLAALISASKTD